MARMAVTASLSSPGYLPLGEEDEADVSVSSKEHASDDFISRVQAQAAELMFASVPQFNVWIFLRQLAAHYFHPISLLMIVPHCGWQAAVNQLFVFGPQQNALTMASVWRDIRYGTLLWVCNFVCIYQVVVLKNPTFFFIWPGQLLANVFALMRFAVIAVKYGYLTAAEEETMLNLPHKASRNMNRANMIFYTFFQLSPTYVTAEIHRIEEHMMEVPLRAMCRSQRALCRVLPTGCPQLRSPPAV